MASISVIGLGAMGGSLAEAFLKNGHEVTVWNRTSSRADRLVEMGAARAADVSSAARASELVVVCVLDYPAMKELLDSDAISGRVVVNLTNGTPVQARETAEWAEARGASYIDGGIMAVPPMIGRPEALILYSGAQDAFAAHEQTLGSLGSALYLGEDPGIASLQDLALLAAMYGMFAGFFQSIAMVRTEKIEATRFSALVVPWLNAMVGELPNLARQIDAGDYTLDVVSPLGMQAEGLANVLQASKDQGVSPALLAPLHALMTQRVAEGHGTEDVSGVIELLPA